MLRRFARMRSECGWPMLSLLCVACVFLVFTVAKPVLEAGNEKIQDIAVRSESLAGDLTAAKDALEKQQKVLDDMQAELVELQGKAASLRVYPEVKKRNEFDRKRILITGGAGFVGSHLVDVLMMDGHEVIVMDNFFTGRKRNVEHWLGHPNFELVTHDVVEPFMIEVDEIYHLASPASPPHYMFNPVKTIKTNSIGTINMLGLAKRVNARLLLASTSEIYGDPTVHPQPETYWGNVNTVGPRSCYDEGKRIAETMCYAYEKQSGVEVRVARIFNTFGPRMHIGDGRVVSNFIIQALQGDSMTVYGEGKQTRSFQYVSDLVDGLVKLMNSNYTLPVNLGNPDEYTMLDFAEFIRDQIGNDKVKIIHKEQPTDDPQRRKPDITRAKKYIGWEPKVKVIDGLKKTIEYFRQELNQPTVHDSNGHLKEGPYAQNNLNQPRVVKRE